MRVLIKNGDIISHSTSGKKDILIEDNIIVDIAKNIKDDVDKIIDAEGLTIIPGIIDMHVHLREPGFEYKETIESGLKAAVHGGVTTVGVMPNTSPAMDSLTTLQFVVEKSKRVNLAKVMPISAITKERKGKDLVNIEEHIKNGFKFFSDDGSPVYDSEIMFKALKETKKYDGIVIDHCEDSRFGNTPLFESLNIARNIEIAKYLDAHIHIAHISTKNSIDLLKYAKSNKIKATCEITFHHLLFENHGKSNPIYKINPPLPDKNTQKYLIDNFEYIDIIISDHAPHSMEEKSRDYNQAPPGISGLDIFFPAIYTVSRKYNIPLSDIVEKVTYNPAKIFNLEKVGDIKTGYFADITIVDLNSKWDGKIYSKGKNMPYKELEGKVVMTIVNGEIKYDERMNENEM
ncbi:hypothetical protein XO10_01925 [Marinitoga sp. 1135]|uniref:dihydroorotase n=1 Tax=unclassified Marinitoga TaxID=2640159 RepID=UPI001586380C|nr:hypothetical protein [Marinitoga sp. 1135]NUU97016.1 hypothetical protein [Marinitoga sp. 1138]